MYEFLKGILIEKNAKKVVVEVGSVGYRLLVPFNQLAKLPELECEVFLYTHFHQKENEVSLFGFIHEKERNFFEMLIQISGVGPKMALTLLGHFELKDLLFALHQKDVKLLTKIPGVGKKTALRILLELQDKILDFEITDMPQNVLIFSDATKALVQLGYPETKAQKAVRKLLEEQEHIELTQLVTQALQII